MPSTEPVEKVVATAISLVVGLSDNMQITFQSGFEGDEPDAVVNARLDRLIALANRQKAKAEAPAIEAELAKQRETLSQFEEDLARVNADHDRLQAERRAQLAGRGDSRADARKKFEAEINVMILEMQQVRQETYNNGLAEFQAGGRTGVYSPKGHTKVALERIDQQIERAKEAREADLARWDEDYDVQTKTMAEAIETADAEREQAVRNLNISIKRYQDAIAVSAEKLAKASALAGD